MRILVSNDDGIYSPGIVALAEVASEFGSVRVVAPDVERSSMGHAITASRPLSYRLRGVALSAPSGAEPDFEPFKPWIRRVLETLLPDPSLPLVNVNFPRKPRGLVWTRVSVRRYDGRIVPTKDPLGRELYWFTITPIEGAEEGTDRWAVEQGWISLTPLRLDLTDEEEFREVRARRPLDEAMATAISPAKSSREAAQSVREDEASAPIEETVGAGALGPGSKR
jgi:broad specificity polyphosphatase/5'/3'-nucleotidase SurE